MDIGITSLPSYRWKEGIFQILIRFPAPWFHWRRRTLLEDMWSDIIGKLEGPQLFGFVKAAVTRMKVCISVVIPTYNRADYLEETLRSVLTQTHEPDEVIVVDDGSTDDTGELVRSFGPPVRYLRIENSGVSQARNVGVEASRSPWIAFCDSDDLWCPDKLARQAELVEAAPEAQFHFCNFLHIVDGQWVERTNKFNLAGEEFWRPGRVVLGPDQWLFTEPLYARLLQFQPVFPSTILINRALFGRLGGYNAAFGRTLSEDLEFTLRCVSTAPIAAHAEPLAGIRKHASNMSGCVARVLLGEIEILRHALAHHEAAARYEPILRDQITERSIQSAEALFAIGDLQATRQALRAVPLSRMPLKLAIKGLISRLPERIGRPINSYLVS